MTNQSDTLSFIMEVEEEGFDVTSPSHLDGLQALINTGQAFQLQGSWGRLAVRLIELGYVTGPYHQKKSA